MTLRGIARGAIWTFGGVGLLWIATWLLGGPTAERALIALDQRRLEAYATHLKSELPRNWRIEGFIANRRIALPAVWYYEGCSRIAEGPISDHVRQSFVVWYGPGATVVLEDGLWFPGSAARIRTLAETGYSVD